MNKLARTLCTTGLTLTIGTACTPPAPHAYVAGDPEAFPRIRFDDGEVSANDRCPVRKNKLNPRLDGVLVNGHPVGFC